MTHKITFTIQKKGPNFITTSSLLGAFLDGG